MHLNERNSFSTDPITRPQVIGLINSLERFWEDTALVTKPNQYHVVSVGNLKSILETLMRCKDFDNTQTMMNLETEEFTDV